MTQEKKGETAKEGQRLSAKSGLYNFALYNYDYAVYRKSHVSPVHKRTLEDRDSENEWPRFSGNKLFYHFGFCEFLIQIVQIMSLVLQQNVGKNVKLLESRIFLNRYDKNRLLGNNSILLYCDEWFITSSFA